MKYKLHIPFGIPDHTLLHKAVESARDIGNIHLWADGVPCPGIADTTPHELGLVTIVSLINMCIKESEDDDVMFLMHNDAEAMPGIAKKFKEYVESQWSPACKWGVIFSHYDVLCAFNMTAVRAVGYWDTMYFQYTADIDYYHNMRAFGWDIIDFPDGHEFRDKIIHHGSTQRKSDALFSHRTSFRDRSRFDQQYYEFKWGGIRGRERFSRPFQNFDGKPWKPK